MQNKKSGRKSWHSSTLIRRALNTKNENSRWKCIWELHSRGTIEVFQAAKALCASSKVRERQLGANILGQLGSSKRPFRRESLNILHRLLKTEVSIGVLDSVLIAISHSQEPEDTRGIKTISGFGSHRSEKVRFGTVLALLGHTDRFSVSTLIRLSRDKSPDVRNWATFGLGSKIDLDTPAVRKALGKRLKDSFCDVRYEALMGLGRRKNPSVKQALLEERARQEQAGEDVSPFALEAIEELID